MDRETFTFVACTSFGHVVEHRHCSRTEADKYFDKLIDSTEDAQFCAYYCASVGGLVNAWALA